MAEAIPAAWLGVERAGDTLPPPEQDLWSPEDARRLGARHEAALRAAMAVGGAPRGGWAEQAPGPSGPGLHDVLAALLRIEDRVARIEDKVDALRA